MLFNSFYAFGYRFSGFTPIEINTQPCQSKPKEHQSCVREKTLS